MGSAHPVVRRHASRMRISSSPPIATSMGSSRPCRSRKALYPPPPEPMAERQYRIQADHQGDRGEQPVENAGPLGWVESAEAGPVDQVDQWQRPGEEHDQIELAALRSAGGTPARSSAPRPRTLRRRRRGWSTRQFASWLLLIVDLRHRGRARGCRLGGLRLARWRPGAASRRAPSMRSDSYGLQR